MSSLGMSLRMRAGVVAVIGLAIGLPVLAIAWRPAALLSTPSPGPSSGVAAAGSAVPSDSPSPRPTIAPDASVGPIGVTCDLPEALPLPSLQDVTPRVSTQRTLLFASPLYRRDGDTIVVARDDPEGDWAMGLWLVSPGAQPRLVLEPGAGMALPLALSADGLSAAIWWLPARRNADEEPCAAGVYRLSIASGRADLLTTIDQVYQEGDERPYDASLWTDPTSGVGQQLTYEPPRASFSADSAHLAIIERDRIRIFDREPGTLPAEHAGGCPISAWSPAGATFVAGCEDGTSAWYARLGEGFAPTSIALPLPHGASGGPDWEAGDGRAIGLTTDGRIRVARFYGFATGCEGPEACHIPPLGYSITTIVPATLETVDRVGLVEFLAGSYEPGGSTRFAVGATWLYVSADDGARTLDGGSGRISIAKPIGIGVGLAADGSAVFGTSIDVPRARVVVHGVHALGVRTAEALLSWPLGAATTAPVIEVLWLVAI
jgi:hypothetical protein